MGRFENLGGGLTHTPHYTLFLVIQPNRADKCFRPPSVLVEDKKHLPGRFKISLNELGVGVPPNQRAVHNKVFHHHHLMEMTKYCEVSPLCLIQLGDTFADGDSNSPYPSVEPKGVSVHEAYRFVEYLHVRDSSVGDKELHPRLIREILRKVAVHILLKRVSPLGCDMYLLGHAPVISRVAW